MEIKTVSILGLGAEGSIVYDTLRQKLKCEQVRILARDERAQRLRREGIVINGRPYSLCVAEPGSEPHPDLLIVSVKGYQLESALNDIAAEVGAHTIVLSLMNGLTSEDIIGGRIGREKVIDCMSRLNASKSANRVDYLPVGQIYIGERRGAVTERVRAVHQLLSGSIGCVISPDIQLDIWRKYMFNAACNTVETIFRCTHLWFQKLPEACAALECVMQEIVRLANAIGVPLSEQDIRALDGYFNPYPPEGRCSMAQDMRAGRPTEIDLLIGQALELGKANGVDLPVCGFVYHIVKAMEQARSELRDDNV